MKKIIYLAALFYMSTSYCQKDHGQQYIDTFQMRPITIEKLEGFKKKLQGNEELKGWTKYYAFRCYYFFRKMKKDSALFYADKAIKHHRNFEADQEYQTSNLQRVHFVRGYYARLDDRYKEAVRHYHKGLKIARFDEKLFSKKSNYLPYIARDLGNSYLKLGYLSSAKKYYSGLLTNLWFMNRAGWEVHHKLGLIYSYQKVVDSADYHFHKGLSLIDTKFKEHKNYEEYKATFYGNLGSLFLLKKEKDSAIHYFKLIKETGEFAPSSRLPKRNTISDLYRIIYGSYVAIWEGRNKPAIENLKSVQKAIEKNELDQKDRAVQDLRTKTLDGLIMAYTAMADFRAAFETSLKKNALDQTVNDRILRENLEELEAIFEVREKERKIGALENISHTQESSIKQQKTIIYFLLFLLLIICLIGYLLWEQKNLKNKLDKEYLKQKLLQTQLDPHFVFNTLNCIYHLTHKNAMAAASYILKFSKLLRLVLQNSREEFVSLKDEISTIQNYMELQSQFVKKFDFSINCDNQLSQDDIFLPPMFVQPFIENTIDHGFRSDNGNLLTIDINIDKIKNILEFTIVDNGIGYYNTLKDKTTKVTERHRSLSGKILEERLLLYANSLRTDATYEIQYADEKHQLGTRVQLQIPFINET
ncbi:histidine kinase [Maribacter sp. 2-571]|uniref:histidine kinase n=1 Tax=Maribacter sp. 2-571 TaxID=3417569 RepID=UPI003D34BF99